MIEIAVLGFGTVGSGVVELIDNNQEWIRRSVPEGIHVKYILDIREFPNSPYADRVVHNIDLITDQIKAVNAEVYEVDIEAGPAPASAIFILQMSRDNSSHSAMLSSIAELECVRSVQELIS